MRVVPAVRRLRRRKLSKAMRDATITVALRERFRIIHISLQRTHVHMLVEAEHKAALARGMQGFQIVFPDGQELQDKAWMGPIRETYDPLVVFRPRTWLLSEGWKLAGDRSARAMFQASGVERRA
jgi:hypothetical protein